MNITTLEEMSARIEKWKAERGITGNDYVPRNSGKNRTPEKRALLQWIYDECKRKGKETPFKANF